MTCASNRQRNGTWRNHHAARTCEAQLEFGRDVSCIMYHVPDSVVSTLQRRDFVHVSSYRGHGTIILMLERGTLIYCYEG